MTKMTNELGFLSPAGEEACKPFKAELTKILATQTNPIYARSLGCMLAKMVGDEVSETMRRLQCASIS
jgi:hypothetical protein